MRLTVRDIARHLGKSERTVRRWLVDRERSQGLCLGRPRGKGHISIEASELQALLALGEDALLDEIERGTSRIPENESRLEQLTRELAELHVRLERAERRIASLSEDVRILRAAKTVKPAT